VTFSIDLSMALAEAEEGQNRQNHNYQADEIDKTVHSFLPISRPLLNRQSAATGKVPPATGKDGNGWSATAHRMTLTSFDLVASVPTFGLAQPLFEDAGLTEQFPLFPQPAGCAEGASVRG
jgi:hypothetical protein